MNVFVLLSWCEDSEPVLRGVYASVGGAVDRAFEDAAILEWPDQTQVNYRLALLRDRCASGNAEGSWGYSITELEVGP